MEFGEQTLRTNGFPVSLRMDFRGGESLEKYFTSINSTGNTSSEIKLQWTKSNQQVERRKRIPVVAHVSLVRIFPGK